MFLFVFAMVLHPSSCSDTNMFITKHVIIQHCLGEMKQTKKTHPTSTSLCTSEIYFSVWFLLLLVLTSYELTSKEANPPEARVKGHAHLHALVERKDDPLLQVEPVVGAHGDPQKAEATNGEHAAQQRQRLPAAQAHTTGSTAGGAQLAESGARKKESHN